MAPHNRAVLAEESRIDLVGGTMGCLSGFIGEPVDRSWIVVDFEFERRPQHPDFSKESAAITNAQSS